MKKVIYAATVLFVLAGASAPAVTSLSNHIADKKTTQPSQPGQPGPNTDVTGPPRCPMNDPQNCQAF